ncbi:hypothetical protein [Shewanella vaxholmensis]|uniref:hypothetical protein n=1 Tax=Shewanella vaxholmensis TaxID=3063535 RepID=UPI0031846B90
MDKALARYKTSESIPLELYFPMEYLQDTNFGEVLGEDLVGCGSGWEVITNVSAASESLIPPCKGIYLFIWKPSFSLPLNERNVSFRYVVYVGSASTGSSNILKRFTSEYKDKINTEPSVHWTSNMPSDRLSRLKKVLNLGKLEYWYIEMDKASGEQIQDIEKRLINIFNPPGNSNFKAPIRAIVDVKKTAPAFEPAF